MYFRRVLFRSLPLPAQFLNDSNRLAGIARAGVSYRLISLWPINKRSGPKTPFENTGLSETLQHPDRRYSEVVMIGQDPYLQALYADKAVSDRKSTRLNSSHGYISYAVFCLKK